MSLDNLSRGTKREENRKEEGSKGDFLVLDDKLFLGPCQGEYKARVSLAGNNYSHMELYIFISINYKLIGTGDEKHFNTNAL